MTEDLTPAAGRVFVGEMHGRVTMVTVKSVRRRRDGTPSSCRILWESPGVGDGEPVLADGTMSLPKDGKMHGWRRVTVSRVGIAKDLSGAVGSQVPTDALVIVANDRIAPDAKQPQAPLAANLWKT